MAPSALSYDNILRVVDLWLAAGGRPKVEIGALEPLLWRDGAKKVSDVVAALVDRGCLVNLTTNGQLLEQHAPNLKRAGLALLRTSWHTTDTEMFRELSGGYGDYKKFYRGISLAGNIGLRVAFNRVLLKGYTSDLTEQIDYVESHKSSLKLYTLLWTPAAAAEHAQFYQHWRPVIRQYVFPRATGIRRVGSKIGRRRIQFQLRDGGEVELKLGDRLDRSSEPCASCVSRENCEEAFGDYVRIDPRLHIYFCYLRRDLGFPISDVNWNPQELRNRIQATFKVNDVNLILGTSSLRFTITPICNFNCRSPGSLKGWCMEEPGEYIYPRIRPSIFK
jgi:cyclic pyranopterin phosphate synthase